MSTVNGISWSAPPPAAVPAAPIVSPEAQMAEGAAVAPAIAAERDASIAQNKAKAETAPLLAQTAAMKADDEMLSRIAPTLAANPNLATAPAFQRILGPILQRRGLQVPMTNGQVDGNALAHMLTPPKPASEMTAEDVRMALEQPPGEARKALLSRFSGYDPSLLTAPQIMTATAQEAVRKNYDTQYYRAVTGNMTPAQFMAWMNSERSGLIGANIDPTAIERDPQVIAGLGAKTQAEIAKLTATGILDQARARQADEEIRKAQSVEELNRIRAKYVGAQIQHLSVKEEVMLKNANTNALRANAYAADVSQRIANAQNGSWADRNRLLTQDLRTAVQERDKANTDYRLLQTAAQQARNAGEEPDTSLIEAIGEAQARRDKFDQVVKQIKDPTTAATAMGSALGNITGHDVKTPGGTHFDKSQALFSRSQPWVAKMPDGSIWDTRANPPKMVKPPDSK